jgi:DNA/RNA-binding domain of Phe-tRNA-synthetase-like protein
VGLAVERPLGLPAWHLLITLYQPDLAAWLATVALVLFFKGAVRAGAHSTRVHSRLTNTISVSAILLEVDNHPLLRAAAFTTAFPAPVGAVSTPHSVLDALRLDASAPLERNEETRAAVRDMLRHGGYKPTGRGKPASEYLVRAAAEGTLGSINAAVDACNAVSLHSGFPISVVDLDRARGPFRIAIAPQGASYVFNASGQEIDLAGLLCLFETQGPCANAVRDAQRTKTNADTQRTLSVIWGCAGFEARLEETERWYRELLAQASATTEHVEPRVAAG